MGEKAKPVVNTSRSPWARLCPVPSAQVKLEDSFWAPRLRKNHEVSLPNQYEHLERTGRLDNLRIAACWKEGTYRGPFYNDSDVYKWAEAAAWSLIHHPDPELEARLDAVIELIAAAQQPDGYLNSYFMFQREAQRWTNLRDCHELYCGGHLIQAAIAHARATGKASLLGVAQRWAEHICQRFGPEREPGTSGHPEVEMALVELFRETGDRRYLDLCAFFCDQRGRGIIDGMKLRQDHLPVREQREVVGHAVRQLYLAAGLADLYAETGDQSLRDVLEDLWRSLTERRMYVTGGAGSRYSGEAFGEDYELPNRRAYCETCAAVANVMFNFRMLLLTGEARFADVLELALYNAVLSGWALNGVDYFYCNPLESRGEHRRTQAMWDATACCPPNVARLVASLPGYFYCTSEEGVWLNLFGASTAELTVNDTPVAITQRTDYPWSGEIEISVAPAQPCSFSLFVRIPGWARSAVLDAEEVEPGAFLEVRRNWKAQDTLKLSLAMPVERIAAHPHVTENTGRVALKRGPLVYCLESCDHPEANIFDIVLPSSAALQARFVPELLGGVCVISGEAVALDHSGWAGQLYRPQNGAPPARKPVKLTAIPYYAWANRDPGAMLVWIAAE